MRFDMIFSTVRAITMRSLIRGLAAALFLAVSLSAKSQVKPTTVFGLGPGQTSAIDLEFHYAYFHANAPPAECGCFSMNGGGANLTINMVHGFSVVTDVTAAYANKVDGTTQNIKILNFMAGPRYSHRSTRRWTPYVQVLLGGSEEFSNDAYIGGEKSAFAVSGGGGVSRLLSSHFAWNIVEADYVYSQIPNAKNDVQNDLRVTTGIVFRTGPR
jgi:outer membrane immunogenic protein